MRVLVLTGLIAIVLGAFAAPAHAQSDTRDEDTATLISAGGTLAPVVIFYGSVRAFTSEHPRLGLGLAGLAYASLLVGPAAGHWYAGDYWTTGMTVRGSGLLGIGIGMPLALSGICLGRGEGDSACGDSSDAKIAVGITLMILGTVAVVVGTGVDLARADDAARAYNEEHDTLRRAPDLSRQVFSFGGQF